MCRMAPPRWSAAGAGRPWRGLPPSSPYPPPHVSARVRAAVRGHLNESPHDLILHPRQSPASVPAISSLTSAMGLRSAVAPQRPLKNQSSRSLGLRLSGFDSDRPYFGSNRWLHRWFRFEPHSRTTGSFSPARSKATVFSCSKSRANFRIDPPQPLATTSSGHTYRPLRSADATPRLR